MGPSLTPVYPLGAVNDDEVRAQTFYFQFTFPPLPIEGELWNFHPFSQHEPAATVSQPPPDFNVWMQDHHHQSRVHNSFMVKAKGTQQPRYWGLPEKRSLVPPNNNGNILNT
jgi:hypothetical protein